jgi:hypothetical protein
MGYHRLAVDWRKQFVQPHAPRAPSGENDCRDPRCSWIRGRLGFARLRPAWNLHQKSADAEMNDLRTADRKISEQTLQNPIESVWFR